MSTLATAVTTTLLPELFVRAHSTVIVRFDERTQDSGNVSWLVQAGSRTLFIKTAGSPDPPHPGTPVPYLDFETRVALLRNAVRLADSSDHPALPRLLNAVESPLGPMLVYEKADGELLATTRSQRADPASAYQRFARLPATPLLGVFDVLIDLHAHLAARDWVASDLYDGCLMVDLTSGRLTVIDLDNYRQGPSINTMGRMFGSTRFMAPEEFQLGALIDQRTTVFTLGRLVWHFATRLTELPDAFCGTPKLAAVVRRACATSRQDRYPDVAALAEAWSSALGSRRS